MGGGYFIDLEDEKGAETGRTKSVVANESARRGSFSLVRDQSLLMSSSLQSMNSVTAQGPSGTTQNTIQDHDRLSRARKNSDNDEPAHLYMYGQYAMTAQPISKLTPARRLSPTDEGFYPTVAVQALMRILKDPSLSNLHGMVMKVRCSELQLVNMFFARANILYDSFQRL